MPKASISGGAVAALLAASIAVNAAGSAPVAPAFRIGTFHLGAPVARVMPMFTALGERAWTEGWEPKMLSGAAERGSAFTTADHRGRTVTWIVTEYLPETGRVSYARLVPDSNIGLVDVTCAQSGDGGTDVAVRYTLTPLTEPGRSFVEHFLSEPHYAQMIEHWHAAVRAALERTRG